MKRRAKIFIYYFLFWYLYFICARILFLIYHANLTEQNSFKELLLVMVYGSRLDLSAAGYATFMVGLLLAFTAPFKAKWLKPVVVVYTVLLLVFSSLIVTADLELYSNWGYRLDVASMRFFNAPNLIFASNSWGEIIRLLTIFGLLLAFAIFMFNKFIAAQFDRLNQYRWKFSLLSFFLTGILFLPARGSLGLAPLNVGFVYFHQNLYLDHAAINVVWNAMNSLHKFKNPSYPNNFLDQNKTRELFKEIYADHGTTRKVLHCDRPNIILVILESFIADVVGSIGREKGVTPNLDRLTKEGILFDLFFSSGDRTDKAIPAVLSGYPAQPTSSVMKVPEKTQTLCFLSRNLKALGYSTHFMYGGNINFANLNSFLINGGFDKIVSQKNFPKRFITTKWGVHDHIVLGNLLDRLDTNQQPFFQVALTLSSHPPYDVPGEPVFKGKDRTSLFLNSVCYTDKAIGTFIENLKKKPYWENTLVIMVSDHGTNYREDINYTSRRKFHIFMLWLGGALSLHNTVMHVCGSQTDIPTTILNQLGISNEYIFGKDLFSSDVPNFACYFFNNGYGFVTDSSTVIYDLNGKKYLVQDGKITPRDLDIPKAYLQMIYSDYNNRFIKE